MTHQNIRLSFENEIAWVTVDRPKALNALNTQTLHELSAAFETVHSRPTTRALILTGEGEKAFVAGADIAEMASFSAEQARVFVTLGHETFLLLETLPCPTLAAINGFALGGGLELALCCDLIYASEKAKFGLPEVGLGIMPGFGGTQRLPRRIGSMRAKELIFTGEMITAERAKHFGLVLEILAPEKLPAYCGEVARKIGEKSPFAVQQSKRVVIHGMESNLATGNELERQAFSALFGLPDQREGITAFLEKRSPLFRSSGK